MHGIVSQSTNPAINLATEEFLLKHTDEEFLFLYTDEPCIIVGKHQNAYSEINFKAIQQKNIPVYRRLSGGGTVYHDLGNLNYCFITSGKPGMLVDFKGFTDYIIKALNKLNIEAYFGGRNDLLIDGKKISGNASHVYKSRVMHHGTLLFNSNLNNLGDTLKTDPSKYKDRAVKSVRSLVTNIINHTTETIDFEWFKNYLLSEIVPSYPTQYHLTENNRSVINDLIATKYSKWEWNFGYSPDYTFKKRIMVKDVTLQMEVDLEVKKGVILKTEVKSNKFQEELSVTFQKLITHNHELSSITNTIGYDLKILLNIESMPILVQLF
jgi:lipoate---protein ligase